MFRLFRFRRLTFLPICTCLSHFFFFFCRQSVPSFSSLPLVYFCMLKISSLSYSQSDQICFAIVVIPLFFFFQLLICLKRLTPIGNQLFHTTHPPPISTHKPDRLTNPAPPPTAPLIRTSEQKTTRWIITPKIALLAADREPSQPIIVLLVLSLAAASLVFGATLLGRRGRSLQPSACPSVRPPALPPACPPVPFSTLCFAVLASQRRVHINHSTSRFHPTTTFICPH